MKKLPIIILLIYLLVTLVGVTFAWMKQSDLPSGKAAQLTFDGTSGHEYLNIASRDVTFSVKVLDEETGEYVLTDSTSDLDEMITKNNVVPGQPIYFKLVFTNSSTTTQYLDILLADIKTEKQSILANYYFSVYDSTGYPEYVSYSPNGIIDTLDNMVSEFNGFYSATLIKNLMIPSTYNSNNDTVGEIEVYCYLLLNRLTESEYEDTQMSFGYFRAVL